MLYLLDANVLITAHNTYYPIDQVPEFWEWLAYQGTLGHVKMVEEIIDEIKGGKDDDPLAKWVKQPEYAVALALDEAAVPALVQRAVEEGYAVDLTDDEIEYIGRDAFLIAYALAAPARTIVTTEVSKPGRQRHKRHLPDVCRTFDLPCLNTFQLIRTLGFKTAWKG